MLKAEQRKKVGEEGEKREGEEGEEDERKRESE
jgi:hypothetical protein